MAVAAIFDLDGTLVTFKFDIREWRKMLLGLMKDRGFDTSGLDAATPTQQILDHARGQVASGSARFDELRNEAFSVLDSLELKGVESSSVYPDVVDTLRRLKSKGVRLCVLTNSGRKAASLSLKKDGLLGFFEFVLTRNDTDTMKPRPEGLVKAVEKLGLRPAEVFYVGDSAFDIIAAKRAGVKVVGVATGNYTPERLESEGADFVVGSLSELPKILGVLP